MPEIRNRLLVRQLKRFQASETAPPSQLDHWQGLLGAIERAYDEFKEQEYLVSRAEQLAIGELGRVNSLLQSERDTLDATVKRRTRELEATRRFAGLGSFLFNPQTEEFDASSEFINLLGESESVAKSIQLSSLLDVVDPTDRIPLAEALFAASVGAAQRDLEIKTLQSDGSVRWIVCKIAKFADPESPGFTVHGSAMDVTNWRRAEQRVNELAWTDQLTGLPNRQSFAERCKRVLEIAEQTQEPCALLFLDLDGFKEINDSMGHDAGDELLKVVARRIKSHIQDDQCAARFGGDEFLVILPNVRRLSRIDEFADKLRRDLCRPISLSEGDVCVSGTIGVAMFPADGRTLEELLRAADLAMYSAKNAGKNQVAHFQKKMYADLAERQDMLRRLRCAIDHQQLEVHYQPIVRNADHWILGVEALVRWTDPELGSISPAVFIPLAESAGLIERITNYVMNRALSDLGSWDKSIEQFEHQHARELYVSINVSPLEFHDEGFLTRIETVLNQHQISRRRIQVEITEGALMKEPQKGKQTLDTLRSMGLKIALDDFGTGYSSLAYLQQFPIDSLKIDRAFVKEIKCSKHDVPLIRAIVAIAQSLGMQTTGEGIETLDQELVLSGLGCDALQGFRFYKPMPAAALCELLLNSVKVNVDPKLAPTPQSALDFPTEKIEAHHSAISTASV